MLVHLIDSLQVELDLTTCIQTQDRAMAGLCAHQFLEAPDKRVDLNLMDAPRNHAG